LLHALGDCIELGIALASASLFDQALMTLERGIGNLIDAVAEAHDELFRRHHF
jgi:hypothetical protein